MLKYFQKFSFPFHFCFLFHLGPWSILFFISFAWDCSNLFAPLDLNALTQSQPFYSIIPFYHLEIYKSILKLMFIPIIYTSFYQFLWKSRSQFATFVTIIAAQFPVFGPKPEVVFARRPLLQCTVKFDMKVKFNRVQHRAILYRAKYCSVTKLG